MATSHPLVPALVVLGLAPLFTVTEGRIYKVADGMLLNQDSPGNSEFQIDSLKSLIKMITKHQVTTKDQGLSQGDKAEEQLEMKIGSLFSADAQKRSELESGDDFHGVMYPLKQKRYTTDKNKDQRGEHLNPTDFKNAGDIDSTGSDPPKGAHDPTENNGLKMDLFEGDIVPSAGTTGRQGRNMIIKPNEKWPRGEVPYVIASGFSSKERATIAKAVLEFERNTCIRVRPLGPSDDANDGYVRIIKGDGCFSSVGRQASPGQELSLGHGCLYPGIVVHEFMHALGFWHEQSRPDRDSYIKIHTNNIQAGKKYNFNKYTLSEVQLMGTEYDVGSVMHYGPYAFARDRSRPTITARYASSAKMGQREGLSRKDIHKINKLYQCTDVTAPPTPTVQPEECTDRNLYCKDWAKTGECSKNPLYMKMHCAKSCNTCSKESCQDLNKHCAAWAETGECTKTPSYMSLYCKESCGFCKGGSQVGCSNVSPFCVPWAEQGECQKNPDYMHFSCRKACGRC